MSVVGCWDIRRESYADTDPVTRLTDWAGTTDLASIGGEAVPTYSASNDAMVFAAGANVIGSSSLSTLLAAVPKGSAWAMFFLVNQSSFDANVFGGFGNGSSNAQGVLVRDDTGGAVTDLVRDSSSVNDVAVSSANRSTNTWHVLHLVYNGTNLVVGFDGANTGSVARTSAIAADTWNQFAIGAFFRDVINVHADGLYREVRVYNSDETANLSTIVASMQAGGGPGIAHLIFQFGASNENGDGMTVAGLPASYQGHCLKLASAAVSSLTRSGATATCNTTAAHNLTTGMTVVVAGASPSGFNGRYVVTVTDSDTFTYTMASDPGADATGTITVSDPLYVGDVKIWDNSSAYQNLSQSTSLSGATYLGLGPQLFIGAQMLSKWAEGDCYIVKYCVGVTGTNSHATNNNWSAEDWAESRGMLRFAALQLAAAIKNLLAAGYSSVQIEEFSVTLGATDSIYGLWAYNHGANSQSILARLFEFMKFTDANIPYVMWNQDAIPRDTPSSGSAITCYAEYGHLISTDASKTIDRIRAIHGTNRASYISTSSNYASGDLDSDGLHWTSQGMQKKVDSGWTAFSAALIAGFNAPSITKGASVTASQAGTVLTVTAVASGTLAVGQLVYANGTSIGTISSFGTGSGGTGTYNISASSTYGSTTVTLINWVEDTTFDTLPTISTTTPPADNYAPGAAVTATVTANNFDGGHSIANAAWTSRDDTSFTASGGSLSAVPAKYDGHCIDVTYENAKHYVARNWYWTEVVAPRTLPSAPKQHIRGAIDMTLVSGGTIHTLNIATIGNASDADATLDWTPLSGSPKGHHKGVAMMASDCVRAQLISDDTTTGASISPAANFTRIVKFRVRTVQDGSNLIYGNRGTSTNSSHIGLSAQTTNNQTAVIPTLIRGTTTVIDTGVDVADAGQFAIVAMRRSTNAYSMHYWNGSGVTKRTDVSNSSVTTNVGADVIGWSTKVGIEGLVAETLGWASALTDGEISTLITQMAAENVPAGGGTFLIRQRGLGGGIQSLSGGMNS